MTRRPERRLNLKHGRKSEKPRKPSMKPRLKRWLLLENLYLVSIFVCAFPALHDFTPLDPMPSQFLQP
jgi:hypothetical protein